LYAIAALANGRSEVDLNPTIFASFSGKYCSKNFSNAVTDEFSISAIDQVYG
jgi:hypothetical protein